MTHHESEAEKAARLAHELWSRWMKHYFSLENPVNQHERWIRLMNAPYEKLTEQEKSSDRLVSEPLLLALQAAERRGKLAVLKAVESAALYDTFGELFSGTPIYRMRKRILEAARAEAERETI